MADSSYFLDHPDAQTLAAYVDGTLDVVSRKQAQRHLEHCVTCRLQITDTVGQLMEENRSDSAKENSMVPEYQVDQHDHPTDETQGMFLEGNLSPAGTEEFVRHLARCERCRHLTATTAQSLKETDDEPER